MRPKVRQGRIGDGADVILWHAGSAVDVGNLTSDLHVEDEHPGMIEIDSHPIKSTVFVLTMCEVRLHQPLPLHL